MNDIAEIGEFVQYNGELQCAGPFTRGIMKRELVPGKWYKVINVEISIIPYYEIKLFNNCYIFPCKSFDRNIRLYSKDKYNLK